MNWFDTSGLTSLAKSALKEAQKTIDKALDIQDESGDEQEGESSAPDSAKSSPGSSSVNKNSSDFFASWGLTVSAESSKDDSVTEQLVVTERPAKGTTQSVWGSFAGSFFEEPKPSDSDPAIVRPPKAKSMNVISDNSYDSQDDLFSKSQLVMSDIEGKNEGAKTEERRCSSRSTGLSLLSSRNSSDSVEILSQSQKSTPDSEAISIHSTSHSSGVDKKQNSESVEILPDSLVSPSSIECLGFDSYSSDKNSTPSSNLSPSDEGDKKSTPIGDRTERAFTADSVSLVADDDEDTISYNSISECTAPTVLDTDEKTSPLTKVARMEPQRKFMERELIHLEQTALPQRMQLSENSSNDGSWSDRTLNADSDSMILDPNLEETRKEVPEEEIFMEKLSDSSSFYDVQVTGEVKRSESSAFVNVEEQHCNPPESSESSQKDSVKERTSPISSDSKSESLVKIGSDRTSGHTSGDELETTTSSDIEIIPSPNGENSGYRCTPKHLKQSKFDTMSPSLVDVVLGKSLATKFRGHNRELSEASNQSNTSDESQSENDRLMRRLYEMAEILESRDSRLMEVSRSNAELAESNADLKSQVEALMAKHEVGDISTLTEDYTQRMSALEKKFQQAIREKDQFRKQLDSLKTDSSRKNSSELTNALQEKDEMIAALQEEGEKLSRQQLTQSNIIKKLRAKEKDYEQLVKGLKDKICEQTSELDRLKRSIAAKEEVEVNQIEAVYRLTTNNKRLDAQLNETKSQLDDTTQRLESTRTSLEAARRELAELSRTTADLSRRKDTAAELERDRDIAQSECERLRATVQQLRNEMVQEERRWISREESLRREVVEARAAAHSDAAGGASVAGLLEQLASLQRAAAQRSHAHQAALDKLARDRAQTESSLTKAIERERLTREENQTLHEQLSTSQALLQDAQTRLGDVTRTCQLYVDKAQDMEETVHSLTCEIEKLRQELTAQIEELKQKLNASERQVIEERANLETERKRNAILQEQVTSRGDISPSHSLASDSLSASLWTQDEHVDAPPLSQPTLCDVEAALTAASRRSAEVRALSGDARRLEREKRMLSDIVADMQHKLDNYQGLQEQYDALLQMYGEKEEQLEEVKLDLHDVTQLYKQQLDELIAYKQQRGK